MFLVVLLIGEKLKIVTPNLFDDYLRWSSGIALKSLYIIDLFGLITKADRIHFEDLFMVEYALKMIN